MTRTEPAAANPDGPALAADAVLRTPAALVFVFGSAFMDAPPPAAYELARQHLHEALNDADEWRAWGARLDVSRIEVSIDHLAGSRPSRARRQRRVLRVSVCRAPHRPPADAEAATRAALDDYAAVTEFVASKYGLSTPPPLPTIDWLLDRHRQAMVEGDEWMRQIAEFFACFRGRFGDLSNHFLDEALDEETMDDGYLPDIKSLFLASLERDEVTITASEAEQFTRLFGSFIYDGDDTDEILGAALGRVHGQSGQAGPTPRPL